MIYTEKFKIPLKDIGKDNKIKNRAVLEILENLSIIGRAKAWTYYCIATFLL